MPLGLFEGYERQMPVLRAERLLDAAQAASVPHMGREAQGWYDRMIAAARGVVEDVVRRAAPMFTWNGRKLGSSRELRAKFNEHVSARVDG